MTDSVNREGLKSGEYWYQCPTLANPIAAVVEAKSEKQVLVRFAAGQTPVCLACLPEGRFVPREDKQPLPEKM